MDKPTVYVESSIISNLTSRPGTHVTTFFLQQATRKWWKKERPNFQLFISDVVLAEICKGDAQASRRRVRAVRNLRILEYGPNIFPLADLLIKKHLLPPKAVEDAIHIAIASYFGMDYLLTWNCRHIANSSIFLPLQSTIEQAGFRCPMMTTPNLLISTKEANQ